MSPRKKKTTVGYRDNRWTPKLSCEGGRRIYCSPGCGLGCTLAAYDAAHARGAAMVKKMGSGWSYEVWENLGWHCKAIDPSGHIEMHVDSPSPFTKKAGAVTVFVDDVPFRGSGRWHLTDKDPYRALRALHKVIVLEAELVARVADAVGRATKKGSRS